MATIATLWNKKKRALRIWKSLSARSKKERKRYRLKLWPRHALCVSVFIPADNKRWLILPQEFVETNPPGPASMISLSWYDRDPQEYEFLRDLYRQAYTHWQRNVSSLLLYLIRSWGPLPYFAQSHWTLSPLRRYLAYIPLRRNRRFCRLMSWPVQGGLEHEDSCHVRGLGQSDRLSLDAGAGLGPRWSHCALARRGRQN